MPETIQHSIGVVEYGVLKELHELFEGMKPMNADEIGLLVQCMQKAAEVWRLFYKDVPTFLREIIPRNKGKDKNMRQVGRERVHCRFQGHSEACSRIRCGGACPAAIDR